jgi:hypothetical protein
MVCNELYRSIPNSDAFMVGNVLVICGGYACNFTSSLVMAQPPINGEEEVVKPTTFSPIYLLSTFAIL